MALSDEWKDKIIEKLVQNFQCEPDKLCEILWSLTNDTIGSSWTTLKSLLNLDEAFKLFANRIADEAIKLKRIAEEEVRKAFQSIAEDLANGLQENEELSSESVNLAIAKIQNFEYFQKKQKSNMLKLSSLSAKDYTMMITVFKATISSMDDVVGLFAKSGNIALIALATVFLSIDAILNIRKYWKGEITGKRCCKNILDSTFTLASGVAGGIGGGLVGSLVAGPVGALVGGLVGGLISTHVANYLSDYLTRYIFGVPKEIALENAYNFFGTKMSASNSEINRAYRRMCLKHHPDKGGKKEDFFIVQVNMEIIKVARESK